MVQVKSRPDLIYNHKSFFTSKSSQSLSPTTTITSVHIPGPGPRIHLENRSCFRRSWPRYFRQRASSHASPLQLAALIRHAFRLDQLSRNAAPFLSVSLVVDTERVAKEEVVLAPPVSSEPLLLGGGVRWDLEAASGAEEGLHLDGLLWVYVESGFVLTVACGLWVVVLLRAGSGLI